MIHNRQRLPLRLEALHQRVVVHSGLDQLEGDLPLHWRGLFGQPDLAHATFTKFAHELKTFSKELSRLQPAATKDPIQTRDQSVKRRCGSKECGVCIIARGEQDLKFLPHGLIGQTGAIQEGGTLGWLQFLRFFKHITNMLPTLRCHGQLVSAIWRCSQARAEAQCLFTVLGDSLSTSEVSSMERPPKNLNPTMRLCCWSSLASSFRASWRATISTLRLLNANPSSVTRSPPSLLAVLRLRAYSTRICRINWAQMAKK